ncbi:unnamed protein product [Discula destructiva]
MAANPAQTEAAAEASALQAPYSYRLVKKLHEEEGIWQVEREADKHQFVGSRWDVDVSQPEFAALLDRGAGDAVAAVLNHPNLVSFIDLHRTRFWTGTVFESQNYAIFDYCDAGTLRNFIDKTSVRPKVEIGSQQVLQWLPESLVWHVATSLLSALTWLHDGFRQEDTIIWEEDGSATRGVVEEGPLDRGEDWFPILHRDIQTEQVFFQHPKGIETYGHCKLGGFGRVVVSGHMQGQALGTAVTSEDETQPEVVLRRLVAEAEAKAVVEQELAKDEGPVQDNVVWMENYDSLEKGNRPYFKGTEVFKVGAILYQMMTRQAVPDPEECPALITSPSDDQKPWACGVRHWDESSDTPCPIWPTGVFRLDQKLAPLVQGFDNGQPEAGYTPELVGLVGQLLGNYRRTVDTSSLMSAAKAGYLDWKEKTEEGKRHVDNWDDLVQRETNRRKRDAAEMAVAVKQSGPRALDYVSKTLEGVKAGMPS